MHIYAQLENKQVLLITLIRGYVRTFMITIIVDSNTFIAQWIKAYIFKLFLQIYVRNGLLIKMGFIFFFNT